MNTRWQPLAQRIVHGLGVQPGELIHIQDHAGRLDVLLEILLAMELRGATPFPHIAPAEYIEQVWTYAPRDYLRNWDHHRGRWLAQVDRVLVLTAAEPAFAQVPQDALAAWEQAELRLTRIQEERCLPFLLVAIPTERRARQLGLTCAALEELLLPALDISVEELTAVIAPVLAVVQGGQQLTIRTDDRAELHVHVGDRQWRGGGVLGGAVSNLPEGSIHTTVVEDQTQGSLWLPRAGDAWNVLLYFQAGRIVDIEAERGADALQALFARHTGEPRRIGHLGIGLNPYLRRPIGWTLVDEHVYGALFISLGENRYMGGHNESSLNVDYALPGATLFVDGRVILADGRVVVPPSSHPSTDGAT